MKTLAELRKIAEAATSDGWIYQIEHFSQMGYERSYWQAIGPRRYQTPLHGEDRDQAIADAKFSEVFSPKTVLALLSRLEAAEDALDYFIEFACTHETAFKELEQNPKVDRSWCDCRNWVNREDLCAYKKSVAYFAKHEGGE